MRSIREKATELAAAIPVAGRRFCDRVQPRRVAESRLVEGMNTVAEHIAQWAESRGATETAAYARSLVEANR